MNYISLVAQKTNLPKIISVSTMTKIGQRNIYNLDLKANTSDLSDLALSELYVARHAIIFDKLCGSNPIGSGIDISFSIPEAAKAVSDPLINSAGLTKIFRTRFMGCSVNIIKSAQEILDQNIFQTSDLKYSYGITDYIDTPVMGKIDVSEHAFERFFQRFITPVDQSEIKAPWKTLRKSIVRPRLIKVDLDMENMPFYARLNRGIDINEAEALYKDPLNDTHYIVSGPNDYGIRTLISVFIRKEDDYKFYKKTSL